MSLVGRQITTTFYLKKDLSKFHCKGRYRIKKATLLGSVLYLECQDIDNPDEHLSYLSGFEYINNEWIKVRKLNLKTWKDEKIEPPYPDDIEKIVFIDKPEQMELSL